MSDFNKVSKTKDGLNYWCRACHRGVSEAWNKANPERRARQLRNAQLRSRYGIGIDEYEAKVAIQNGTCAICSNPAKCVDHDHATGKVRGILCAGCNRALGFMFDNPALLHRGAEYLESWR